MSRSDEPSLVYEFEIDAPLEKVWHALTSPELVTQWLLPQPDEPEPDVELELAASTPPRYIAYHWRTANEPASLVSFELRRSANGSSTHLKLIHMPATAHWSGPLALAA